jgi:hypothetical protein
VSPLAVSLASWAAADRRQGAPYNMTACREALTAAGRHSDSGPCSWSPLVTVAAQIRANVLASAEGDWT